MERIPTGSRVKDIKEIHKIMSNIKISGVKASIAKWNEKLAIELEEAIAILQTNMSTIHLGNNHNSTSENKNYDEILCISLMSLTLEPVGILSIYQ
jgi:hypothetical protein